MFNNMTNHINLKKIKMKKLYLLLALLLIVLSLKAQTVQINEVTLGNISTSTFQETPIDADDNYSYSQSIFLQSEINQPGTISKITFYTNGILENSNNIVVYMTETSNDVFASNSDWIPLANLTQVYSGTYTVYGNEVSLILDTPFNYSNTDNLVIAVDENQDGNDTFDFITHNLGYSQANGRVLHYGNNFNNPDPLTPPSGTLDYYRPNIEIDFNPITCYPPNQPEVTNTYETSVDVTWLSSSSSWDYVVQTSGIGNPDNATAVNTTSNTVNITGLTNNTAYEFYVRTNCNTDGVSDWIGPIFFRTTCGIVDDFSENFEALPDELVTPYCWSTISNSTGTAPITKVNTSSSQAFSADNYYEIQMNNDDNFILVSPESTTIADGMHRIEFAAKVNSVGSDNTVLKVGLMSNPNDENTFTELNSFTLTNASDNTNNYSLYYVNIPLNASANHLAFKPETSASFNKIIYLDNIVVTTQPSCFEIINIDANNITDTSFDLTITPDIQTQTEWEMVIVQTDLNFNPALETTINTLSLTNTITTDSDGLSIIPNSPYRIFIRANCDAIGSDGSGYSTWFGPYDIRTACAPFNTNFIENFDSYVDEDFPFCWNKNVNSTGSPLLEVNTSSSYANSGNNAIIMNTGNDANAEVFLILPQHTTANDGTHRLEFFAKKNTTNTDASIIVGTMSDPLNTNTFNPLTELNITTGGFTENFLQYYVNLPSSTDQYVVLKHGAGSGASVAFYIDDVSITDQPTCTEVYNVVAENVTDSSVEVSWDFLSNQSSWEYTVQLAGTGEPTSGTATNTNISNNNFNTLSANTEYEIYVRANCNTNGYSAWVGPLFFTTQCLPESGMFNESFEGFTNNTSIEPCWSSLIDPVSTSPYVRYSTLQSQEGSVSVRMYSGNDESAGIFLISPMISDLDNTKQIRFNVYDDNNGSLEVGTMSDPLDASSFTSYQTFLDEDMTDDAWDEKIVTFESLSENNNYIAFKFNAATTFDNLYLDNFTYENNPSLGTDTFLSDNEFKIYPNPVKNILNIDANNITSISIYSVNGKEVLSKDTNTNKVNVSALANGLYFINIKDNEDRVIIKKFIKN